ncbi:MAG: hypothetical protein NDI69_10515 [Bacteriovoracaceae bacterium]|nr:hypothetical protein [Bacteriovoracaceae bacterium]
MKGQLFSTIVLLTLLSTLAGCGGAGQSSAKLEVSKAFAMTNPYFGGGLMIHGSSSTGQHFTLALDSNLEKTIQLENGTWSFYAVGWDGNQKFVGNRQCGMVTKEISASSVVELNMNSTICSDLVFQKNVKLHEFKTIACGTFNTYNFTTNTYSPISASTPDTFCSSLPMEMRSELSHYKIVAQESFKGVQKPAFESQCLSTTGEILGHLPVIKFPFLIKAYRSLSDCNSTLARPLIFNFPNGIEAGHPETFDHLALQSGTAPAQTRLVLPSSISKRGKSLFMNMIPQFLCETSGLSDCFKSPVSTYHVNVDWYDNFTQRKLLLKNTSVATCPSMSANSKFSFTGCENQDGNLYGHMARNGAYCSSVACADTVVIDSKTISIKTTEAAGNFYLFDEALQILGLRVIDNTEHPYYLFHSLQDNHDRISGGGKLRRVQEHLSSTGILSLVRTGHTSCSALASAVDVASISLPPQSVFDPHEGKSFDIAITISNGLTSTGGTIYDLKIDFKVMAGSLLDEQGTFNLVCGKPIGTFETVSFKDSELERELINWNTDNVATAVFESYSYQKESDGTQTRAEVVKAQKTSATEFWSRAVQIGSESFGAYASVSELHKAGGKIFTTRLSHSDTTMATLQTSIDTPVAENQFMTGTAASCMLETNAEIYSTPASGCSFAYPSIVNPETSSGFMMKISSLMDLNSAAPLILEQFSLK